MARLARVCLLAPGAWLLLGAFTQGDAAPAPETRVLLVDLDDVGRDLVAAAKTPTLDRLRAEGRYYPNLVTSPTCSPSRAMLHSGANCSHRDVLLGRVLRGKLRGSQAYALPTEPLVPLGAFVAGSGRSTAKIGKWHLSQATATDHPLACGWQSYRGVMSNLLVATDSYTSFPKVVGGESSRVEGRYITSDETDDAIAAVKHGVHLVSLSYHAPHKPWHRPPGELLTPRPEGQEPGLDLSNEELTALMLEACDHELGRLLEAARGAGYTVFVFGDNGPQNSREQKGGKGTLLDSGVVVPMWVSGPGVTPGEDRSILSLVDFYATIADLFGLEREPATQGPDSISFAETLSGGAGRREYAISESFDVLGEDPRLRMKIQWRRAVRGERFKLFENRGARLVRLVDLRADPDEEVNLLDEGTLSDEAQAAYDRYREVLDSM